MATASSVTSLRKVGGSVMLTVPPAILEGLHLKVGSKVQLSVQDEKLVVSPKKKLRYTIEELVARCKPGGRLTREEREWIGAPSVGREL
jgi:antitoxin ChpS